MKKYTENNDKTLVEPNLLGGESAYEELVTGNAAFGFRLTIHQAIPTRQ